MKKYIGKFFLIFAILFGFFGGFLFLSATNSVSADVEIHANAAPTKILSAGQFEQLILNWNSSIAQTDYILMTDIDFALETTPIVLHSTFGTEALPYAGTFDGNGFKISNIVFDESVNALSSEIISTNKYFGLFGVTDGATIKNVGIGGTMSVKAGKCTNAYVGALVGKAKNTDISFVQNTAKISFKDDIFSHNVRFGGLVGALNDSEVSYFTSRQNDFGTWDLSDNNQKTYEVGGVVGSVDNSRLIFGISSNSFKINENAGFYGNLILGGICGTISQNNSQIFNCVLENNYAISELQTNVLGVFTIGQVVGSVLTEPAPENISYVYYKTNVAKDVFGDDGAYESGNSVVASISTIPVSVNDFSSKTWHTFLGGWDFGTIWYEGAAASLQAFSGNFILSMSANSVLQIVEDFAAAYRYGSSAAVSFRFKEVVDGTNRIDMADYYTITSIALGMNDVVRLSESNGVYTMSDNDKYEFALDNGAFVLIIKNVNNLTAGAYSIKTQAKQFSINVTSKLYTGDNADEYVDGIIPAYVYHTRSPVPQETLPTIKLGYDSNAVTLDTRLKDPKSAYAFVGWYMVNPAPNGEDFELTTSSSTLTINFGHGLFTGDANIYAKYQDDACVFTFKIDDGVKEVDLFKGNITMQVKESNESVAISKKETSVRVEIYIKDGFDFDVQEFLTMGMYKTGDATVTFYTWDEESSRPLENMYVFKLDMTNLADLPDDKLNIEVKTTPAKKALGKMVWYIVGGVGGVLVLVGVIVLIVVIKKRNGGGFGGMSSGSFSKKSYKDMYY